MGSACALRISGGQSGIAMSCLAWSLTVAVFSLRGNDVEKDEKNKDAAPVALGQRGGRSEGGGATAEKPVMQLFSWKNKKLRGVKYS